MQNVTGFHIQLSTAPLTTMALALLPAATAVPAPAVAARRGSNPTQPTRFPAAAGAPAAPRGGVPSPLRRHPLGRSAGAYTRPLFSST